MAVVIWNPLFEFNVPLMDKQHKQIVLIMNTIVERLETGEIDDEVKAQCQKAIVLVTNHFLEEEKLMENIGYPEIDKQKAMHKEIMAKMLVEKGEIDACEDVLSKGFVEEMREMFKKHILEEDRKYGYYYHRGIMPSAD